MQINIKLTSQEPHLTQSMIRKGTIPKVSIRYTILTRVPPHSAMRPRLLRELPVGCRKKLTGAHEERICHCDKCSLEQVIDPISGKTIHGKFCSRAEYQLHQRQMAAQLKRAPAVFQLSSSLPLPSNIPSPNKAKEFKAKLQTPIGVSPPSSSSQSSNPLSGKAYREYKVEESKPKVRGVHQRSALFRLQDLRSKYEQLHDTMRTFLSEDLVFMHPPSASLADWQRYHSYFSHYPFVDFHLGTGRAVSFPECYGCHGADHPRGLCPFPLLPNWHGPL